MSTVCLSVVVRSVVFNGERTIIRVTSITGILEGFNSVDILHVKVYCNSNGLS